MVLGKGEKVLVITRRLFETDLRRHFIGQVAEANEQTARLSGFAFVFDESSGQFKRRDELRQRIISLVDAGNIILLLPQNVRLQDLTYSMAEGSHRVLSDGQSFSLNISEFGSRR